MKAWYIKYFHLLPLSQWLSLLGNSNYTLVDCTNWISMAFTGGLKCVKYLMFIFNCFFWVGVLYVLLFCEIMKEKRKLPQMVIHTRGTANRPVRDITEVTQRKISTRRIYLENLKWHPHFEYNRLLAFSYALKVKNLQGWLCCQGLRLSACVCTLPNMAQDTNTEELSFWLKEHVDGFVIFNTNAMEYGALATKVKSYL